MKVLPEKRQNDIWRMIACVHAEIWDATIRRCGLFYIRIVNCAI